MLQRLKRWLAPLLALIVGALAVGIPWLVTSNTSSPPAPQTQLAPSGAPTGGDFQHQLNQQQAAIAYLAQRAATLPHATVSDAVAADISKLDAVLSATAIANSNAINLWQTNPQAALYNSVYAAFGIAGSEQTLTQLQSDLNPPPPPTTTTTTQPPTTTTTAAPTTTTAPSGQMAPPSGYSASQKIEDDTFQNLNNWNTFYGPGTRWDNRGSLPAPWSGGNTPLTTDVAIYNPAEDVLLPGGGVQLNTVPYNGQYRSEFGYDEESGVLTSKNPLPSDGWYVQVKAQMPDSSSGLWNGIWALPSNSAQELDGIETGWLVSSPNTHGHSDTFASGGQQQQVWTAPGGIDLSAGPNVYGFQFIPGTGMRFYVNGHQVYASSANLSQEAYYLFLQTQVAGPQTSGWHTTGSNQSGSAKIWEVQVYH